MNVFNCRGSGQAAQLPAHYPRKQAAIFRVEKGKGLSDADVVNLQKKIDQAVCCHSWYMWHLSVFILLPFCLLLAVFLTCLQVPLLSPFFNSYSCW